MVNEVAMQKADVKNVELIFHSLSLKSLGWGSCDSQAGSVHSYGLGGRSERMQPVCFKGKEKFSLPRLYIERSAAVPRLELSSRQMTRATSIQKSRNKVAKDTKS